MTSYCIALIKSGKKCKNKSKFENRYCGKHQSKILINIYNYTKNNKYSVNQIKNSLKYYNIPIKSNKKKYLLQTLDNFMSVLKTITQNKQCIIKIQNYFKKYSTHMRGPAIYNRHLCVNTHDFLLFENVKLIAFNNFFSYKDSDGYVYGFHIHSFNNLIVHSNYNNVYNPYNRKKINITHIHKCLQLINNNRLKLIKTYLTKKQLINQRIIQLFQKIDFLDNYTNIKWFSNLNINELKKLYFEIEDIWNYRLNLSHTIKKKLVPPDGLVFNIPFSIIHKIVNKNKLITIIINQADKLISSATEKNDRKTCAMYFLTGLAQVQPLCAIAMPWLIV